MSTEKQDASWGPIDEGILRRELLRTLQAIRAATGLGLKEASDIYHDRYKILRQTRPHEFVCDHETYWQDVYS